MNTLLFLASAAGASAAEFCADRPGLATGTCIAAAGSPQAETSLVEWGHTKSASDQTNEFAIGATRLRFGIEENTDVQVAFTPFNYSHTDGEHSVSGVGDLYLAVKHRFIRGDTVQMAALPFMKLPIAKESIGNRKVEFGILLPTEIGLRAPWSLTITPEADWNANQDGSGHHWKLSVAASIGLDIAKNWSLALDGLIGMERDRVTRQDDAVGLSIAHQLRPNLQVDAETDLGLSSEEPGVRLVTGFAARF